MDFDRLNHLLTEMPLGTVNKKGFEDPKGDVGAWDELEARQISKPKFDARLAKSWKRVPETIDLWFLRGEQWSQTGYREDYDDEGNEIDVRSNQEDDSRFFAIGESDPEFVINDMGVEDFTYNEDNITMLYVSNIGGDKVNMTPWIAAHRIGHVLGVFNEGSRQTFWHFDHPHKDGSMHYAWREHLNSVYELVSKIARQFSHEGDELKFGQGDGDTGFLGNRIDNNPNDLWSESIKMSDVNRIFSTREFHTIVEKLGSFNSARKGILTAGQEVIPEFVAEYIHKGKIELSRSLLDEDGIEEEENYDHDPDDPDSEYGPEFYKTRSLPLKQRAYKEKITDKDEDHTDDDEGTITTNTWYDSDNDGSVITEQELVEYEQLFTSQVRRILEAAVGKVYVM